MPSTAARANRSRFDSFLSLWLGLCATALVSTAASAEEVPEPEGYWTGPIDGAVPATISGGKVIHAEELSALLDSEQVVLIDVSNSPKRPEGMAADAPWIPLAHEAIPGSIWIPDVGLGSLPDNVDEFFLAQLTDETGEDYDYPLVIYCHEACWLSWNAAKRAINHGFRNVHWFPEGIEGWKAAGLETEIVKPRLPPEMSQRNP
jgi:PQQ-dependent catabolism-associated CXXCW motif protein